MVAFLQMWKNGVFLMASISPPFARYRSRFRLVSLLDFILLSLYTSVSMKVIGLTGGIGSGKSTVANFLKELGAVVLDSDKIGHEALQRGTSSYSEVVDAFGSDILQPSGEIDRSKLSLLVFSQPQKMAQLNRIMHPQIYKMVKSRLAELKQLGVKVAVVEVPLLIEAGWQPLFNEIWVTIASEDVVLKRLQGRNKYSTAASLARVRSQISNDERLAYANTVINTGCSLYELKAKVTKLWEKLSTQS